jgi:hypothetical protein
VDWCLSCNAGQCTLMACRSPCFPPVAPRDETTKNRRTSRQDYKRTHGCGKSPSLHGATAEMGVCAVLGEDGRI